MNDRLTQDLWDWEESRLSSEELAIRHPAEDIGGLLALHGALTSLPSDVAADRVWAAIDARLSDRPLPLFQRLSGWLKRPVIALAASTLMGTGVAYAADVGPVRDGVDKVLGGIVRVFGGNDDRDDEPTKDTDRNPGSVPQGSASPSDDDSDDRGFDDGNHDDDSDGGSGKGSDDRDGDDNPGPGSDEDSDDDSGDDDSGDDDSDADEPDADEPDDDSSGKGSDDDEPDEPDESDDSSGGSSHDEDEIDDPSDEIDGGGNGDDIEDLIDNEVDPGDPDGDD